MPNWCYNSLEVEVSDTMPDWPVAYNTEETTTSLGFTGGAVTPDILATIFGKVVDDAGQLARLQAVTRGWRSVASDVFSGSYKAAQIRAQFFCDRFWLQNSITDEKGESRFSFSALCPCDEDRTSRCDLWGTKWDCDADIDGYYGNFDTAWSPPIAWLKAVCTHFPELQLTLTYEEPGCDFAGEIRFKNGEEVSHEEYTYRERPWGDTTYSDISDDESELVLDDEEHKEEVGGGYRGGRKGGGGGERAGRGPPAGTARLGCPCGYKRLCRPRSRTATNVPVSVQ